MTSYFREYSKFPKDNGQADVTFGDTSLGASYENAEVIVVLSGLDSPAGANPRKMSFLTINERGEDQRGVMGVITNGTLEGVLVDSWDKPIFITCDTDFDGNLNTAGAGLQKGRVAGAWSLGPQADYNDLDSSLFITSWN
jgi:hypothetical protein